MKIIRYQDAAGEIHYGCQHADGSATKLDGDIFGAYSDSAAAADVAKLLAPIVPVDILCIGLNYAKHAEEGKHALPEFPVLFMKNIGALQNPGDPIIIPKALKCEKVDFECELGVVIGRECLNVSQDDCARPRLGLHVRSRCQRTPLAEEWRRRPMVPWQNIPHILSTWPLPGDDGRDHRPANASHQIHSERRSDARWQHG